MQYADSCPGSLTALQHAWQGNDQTYVPKIPRPCLQCAVPVTHTLLLDSKYWAGSVCKGDLHETLPRLLAQEHAKGHCLALELFGLGTTTILVGDDLLG